MSTHWDLSDHDFLSSFATGELAPALFTHEAHLRLAYLYLERYGLVEAKTRVSEDILAYVTKLGAADKYHHTLTLAAVQIVDHFRQRQIKASFRELVETFPRLLHDFRGLLECHYSQHHYQKAVARTQYVAPDLLPFPSPPSLNVIRKDHN